MAASPHVLRLLRRTHEEHVLGLLRREGMLSRADLAQQTGLSRTTLTAIIRDLLDQGATIEVPARLEEKRGRGRPPTLLSLNPEAGHAMGIDLARRYVHVVVAGVAHDVLGSARRRVDLDASWEDRLGVGLEIAERLATEHRIRMESIRGIGLGLHGPVVPGTDASSASHGVIERLSRFLADHGFDVPVFVDNNTRLAALAEAISGTAAGSRNVLYVRLSNAIAGGLVLDGALFRGAWGAAGELGHISIDPDGPRCACGGRGCLELYASIDAIVRESAAHRPGIASLDDVLAAIDDGDADVSFVVAQAGRRLGTVLAAVCTAVNPEQVVIGGEMTRAGDALLGPTREALRAAALPLALRDLRLDYATYGEEAGARGAIALVHRESALLARYDLLVADPGAGSDAEVAAG